MIALICLLVPAFSATAQRPFSRDFWLNDANTPVKVNALARDRHGYLWIGAENGLCRFNGHSFTPTPDTALGAVTALAAAGDTVYCGNAGGRIRYFADGDMHELVVGGMKPSSRINSLSWNAGCLWACTDAEGVFAIVNGYGYQLDTRNGLSDNYAYAVAFKGATHALVATDRGINCISLGSDGKFQTARHQPEGVPDNIIRSIATLPEDSRYIWSGMQAGGPLFNVFDPAYDSPSPSKTVKLNAMDRWQSGWPPAWAYGQINDILPVAPDRAWIATEDGFLVDCSVSPERGFVMAAHHYPGKRFHKLLRDHTGSLWCATGDGLTMVTDQYLSYLPLKAPYSLQGITAMACDRQNNLYYTQGEVLYKSPLLEPGKVRAVLRAGAPITCLHVDSANRVWVGTLGAGLWRGKGDRFREMHDVPKLLAGQILDISGIGNRLWVSSLNGVEEIILGNGEDGNPERVVHHGKRTGAGSDYVYQLFPDSRGNMWMATDGAGICMYDGARYHTWDSASGFSSRVVYSITEDSAGHIWAATLDDGLFEYTAGRWRHIDKRQGLQDLAISAIAANASGQVVVVHSKGIDEWHPGSAQFRHYNRRLGMDIDSQSNALNCFATDTAGNVWVPFEHGLICFHNLQRGYDLRPGININKVMLLMKPVAAGTSAFAPSENHIGFHFEGINFTNPERLFYRYKLEGYDNAWVSTIDESITFPQLPPGKYQFRVQASLSQDFSAAREADYAFSVAAPIWKRKWAIALAFALLIGAAYGYLRLREQSLRRAAMLQRERMMAEYEQLKSQVNPHFLFNTLNTLASLIEEDSEAAVQYTIQLSDLYRSMLAFKDRDLIYLSEELALLRKYVFIQQSRFRDCLHLHESIPEDLAAGKQIIPLALQLLVENAIKHNIVSTSRPLHIYIQADADSITVRNVLRPKVSKAAGAGLGLSNISRRYALMSSRSVQYGIEEQEFIVTLPLL